MNKVVFAIALAFGFMVYLIIAWPSASPERASVVSSSDTRTVRDPETSALRQRAPVAVQLSGIANRPLNRDMQFAPSSPPCDDICSRLVEIFTRTDESFDEERVPSDKFVSQLRQDPGLRAELINVAAETSGEKRRLIIAAFAQLDASSQQALGKALGQAPGFNQRLDGIHLLANPAIMDTSVGVWVAEKLAIEQNLHVRSAMVKALNQPGLFYGDADVVEVLSNVIASDTDATVRGEALLAQSRLLTNPEDNLYKSVGAVRSESREYQYYGVLALQHVLIRQSLKAADLSSRTKSELQQLMTELMNAEFDDLPVDARQILDNLSGRFL